MADGKNAGEKMSMAKIFPKTFDAAGKSYTSLTENNTPKFNSAANLSSAIYFMILTVYLGLLINNDPSLDRNKTVEIFGSMIFFLLLPLMYFMKEGIWGDRTHTTYRMQKIIVSIYFILIIFDMIFYIDEVDNNYVVYSKLYILPFLITFTFYLIYEMIKSGNYSKKSNLLVLISLLGLLYYTVFFDTVLQAHGSKKNDPLLIIEMLISIALVGLFLYLTV